MIVVGRPSPFHRDRFAYACAIDVFGLEDAICVVFGYNLVAVVEEFRYGVVYGFLDSSTEGVVGILGCVLGGLGGEEAVFAVVSVSISLVTG